MAYETQTALSQDMFHSNKPLYVDEVYSPDEVRQLYEKNSYSKGASIIRMLSHALTSHVLEESIKNLIE